VETVARVEMVDMDKKVLLLDVILEPHQVELEVLEVMEVMVVQMAI
jgi:hypothetical protein